MRARRPTGTEWAAFQDAMQRAAAAFEKDDVGRAGYTSGTMAALGATIELLQTCGAPVEQWNIQWRLAIALSDLKAGREVAPILRPPPRTRPGPRAVGTDVLTQRAQIAALLDLCMTLGDYPDAEAAARWVARKMKQVPALHGQRGEPWRVVSRWRDEARAGLPSEDALRAVFDGTLERASLNPKLSLKAIANAILHSASYAGGGPIQNLKDPEITGAGTD